MREVSLPGLGALPAAEALRVERLCSRFEAAWQGGHARPRPALKEYLEAVGEPARAVLLCELLRLDVAYRHRSGERPVPEDYLPRFPGQEALVRAVLGEADPTAAGGDGTPPEAAPAGRGDGPAAGVTVPGYEVLGEVGRGGMGVVYRARQLKLGRVVALKVMRTGDQAGAEQLARFRTEAEAVARLQHPGIVQIHEVGEHDGLPYLCLEYVDDGSLADRIDGTPLPPAQAARLVEALARAIHYAHSRGVVHRDLKPANVLLTADGTPKITDFGLAKCLDDAAGPTASGAILGTPSYMAPEQAGKTKPASLAGARVGPAADVYALGAILYELLTGRPPFKAATPLETVIQVVNEEPVAPGLLQPGAPRDLQTVCLKCLQKEPRQRYPAAADLADDLRRFLDGEPIRARPVGRAERLWRWCRRRPAVAGLAAALLLALAGGFAAVTALWLRAEEQRARAGANARRADDQRVAALANFRLARQAVDDYCTRVGNDPRLREKDLEPLRKELLQTAVVFYQKFVAEHADDPEVRAELGRAYARLASLTDDIDDKARAIGFYHQALAVWEGLARDNPADPDYQDRQANCHHRLALLYRDTRRPDDAEKSHRRALDIQETLARDHRDEVRYQLALALSHNSLGNLYRRTGRLDEAREGYTRALKILEELTGKDPGVPDYQSKLAMVQSNLGILYRRTRKPDEAERAYRRAIQAIEALAPDPSSSAPEYRKQLAFTYINLGNLFNERGQTDEAEGAFKKAVELVDGLVRGHPAVTEYQQVLADTHNGLGIAYSRADRTGEAEAAYKRALEIAEPLARKYPLTSGYAVSLGGIYCNLGDLARETGKFRDALDWFDRATHTLEPVIRQEPRNATAKRFLHNTHVNRGLLRSEQGDHDEAMKDWERALALEGKSERDATRSHRAVTLAGQGQYARAVEEVKRLKGDPSRPNDPTLFNAARVYSLASAAVRRDASAPPSDRDRLAEGYAGRALDALARARAAGFFKAPSRLKNLKTHKDLDPIRPRAAFRELLAELERQAQPAK